MGGYAELECSSACGARPLGDRSTTDSATDDVARAWGEISGHAQKRVRPRPVNDTWIAACCLTFALPLATLNVDDVQDFVDHEGLELITV